MAKPQRVTFLKANLKDQPGTLLGVMKDLKSKNIALKSLWGYGRSEETAELFAIAKDPDKLRNAWKATGVFAEVSCHRLLRTLFPIDAHTHRLPITYHASVTQRRFL
jgi:hypothetical protein